MIQKFILQKMLSKQLAGLPKDQQDKIIKVVSENPELFQEIAKEVKIETDKGKDQMEAFMSVMPKFQDRLKEII